MFKFDFADVKPSIANLVIVTLMALLGLALLKFAVAKYPVPGLTDLVYGVLGSPQE